MQWSIFLFINYSIHYFGWTHRIEYVIALSTLIFRITIEIIYYKIELQLKFPICILSLKKSGKLRFTNDKRYRRQLFSCVSYWRFSKTLLVLLTWRNILWLGTTVGYEPISSYPWREWSRVYTSRRAAMKRFRIRSPRWARKNRSI